MSDREFVVEELPAVQPDGTRSVVVVRLGKPFKDDRPHDNPECNTHVCLAQCEGISAEPVRAYGVGPMQALHHGLAVIRLNLESEEARGVRFVWPDGQTFDWRGFWYRFLEPGDG